MGAVIQGHEGNPVAATEAGELKVEVRKDVAVYSLSGTYAASAGDTIIHIANTGDNTIVIDKVVLANTALSAYVAFRPVAATIAGTGKTANAIDNGASTVLNATFTEDETGNSQANVIRQGSMAADQEVEFAPGWTVGFGQELGIDLIAAGTCRYTIEFRVEE